MATRNKYAKRSRISEAKIREVVRYVAADLTALQAAALNGLNRNTVNRLYRGVRERMPLACEAQRPLFGIVEVNESFFGARRVKGRRGRGAYGKTIVFGIFERQGRVYTEIVPDRSKPTLQGIIRGRGSSWLNLVERWFAEITRTRLRRGTFTSVPALERAIHDYLTHYNQQPKPFIWSKDADTILAKIDRCKEALNAPH